MGEDFLGLLFLLGLVGLSWGYFFFSWSFRKQRALRQVMYNGALALGYVLVVALVTVAYLAFVTGPRLPGGLEGLGEGMALGLLAFGVVAATFVLRILSEVAYLLKKGRSGLAP